MWTIELVIIAVMIAFNGVFAAYEIALASVGLARLDTLAREHQRGAFAALRMKQNMEASLAVVQMGITLVGVTAAAIGGAGAEQTIEPVLLDLGVSAAMAQFLAIAIVVIPLTVVTITFGELVPKVFALRNTEWICLRLSPLMRWFAISVWPAVWFFETSVTGITKLGERRWKPIGASRSSSDEVALQELRAIAAVARTSRLIGGREEKIIVNAVRLSTTTAQSILLPAQHISMLNADDSLADSLVAAHHDMHTRFPVTEKTDDPQRIIGYVNFKDIVSCLRLSPQEPSLRAITRSLPSFDADWTVADCLEKLIRERNHIALVRDQGGTVLGMITMEDIVEELVGEIYDEYDHLPGYVTPAGNGWIVGGNADLARVCDVTDIALPVSEGQTVRTLNEWSSSGSDDRPSGEMRLQLILQGFSCARFVGNCFWKPNSVAQQAQPITSVTEPCTWESRARPNETAMI